MQLNYTPNLLKIIIVTLFDIELAKIKLAQVCWWSVALSIKLNKLGWTIVTLFDMDMTQIILSQVCWWWFALMIMALCRDPQLVDACITPDVCVFYYIGNACYKVVLMSNRFLI